MAPRKAKHAENQPALDRLSDLYQTTSQQTNSKYIHTIKRAMDSLSKCEHAITTRKQAVELKFVGPKLAQMICPDDAGGDNTGTTTTSATAGGARTTAVAPSRARRPIPAVSASALSSSSSAAASKISTKEQAYNVARNYSAQLELPSGPWNVILLLDGREHKSDQVQAKLQMSGVPCEQRMLPIGDMAWMATCKNKATGEVIEIMLGTIVERKQVDDLAGSLFGTRYLEQRLRLVHCGLPQLLLLVEGDINAVSNCPSDTLQTAMMETRVHLNFHVVQTPHLDATVRFLKNVHRRILQRAFPSAFSNAGVPSFASPTTRPRLKKRRKKESLADLTFDTVPVSPPSSDRFITYQELKAKVEWDRERGTRTVGAVHLAMLKQIPSLSHKKVQALGQAYPTPSALLRAYDGLSEADGLSLIQDLIVNTQTARDSKIGPKSAAEVYHCMTQGGEAAAQSSSATKAGGVQDAEVPEEDRKMPAVAAPTTTTYDDSSGDEAVIAAPVAATLPTRTMSAFASARRRDDDDDDLLLSSQDSEMDRQVARDAAFAASLARAEAGDELEQEFANKKTTSDLSLSDDSSPAAQQPGRDSLNTTGSSWLVDFSPDSSSDSHVSPRSPVDERKRGVRKGLYKTSTSSPAQQKDTSVLDLTSPEDKRKSLDAAGSRQDNNDTFDLSQESVDEQASLWERCQRLKSTGKQQQQQQEEVIEIE